MEEERKNVDKENGLKNDSIIKRTLAGYTLFSAIQYTRIGFVLFLFLGEGYHGQNLCTIEVTIIMKDARQGSFSQRCTESFRGASNVSSVSNVRQHSGKSDLPVQFRDQFGVKI